jgi:hypothetical protein
MDFCVMSVVADKADNSGTFYGSWPFGGPKPGPPKGLFFYNVSKNII